MNAKRISKSVVAFVLTMMMVISCFALPTSFVNAAGITAKFHYLREDGNYDKWSLWTWTDSDGWSTDFVDEGDANGAVATVEVPDGATSLGFIVRKGNWEAKDPDGDRSVDIGAVVSGTIDVYCKSGSADFDVVNGSDVVLGTKLTKATLNTRTEIAYTLTQADESVTAEEFVVADALGNPLTITGITPDGAKGTITVAEEMDYLKNYTITFRGTTINVKMPEYFSSKEFEDMYTYDGDDLGATYTKEKTSFRVWAPTADQLYLNLYEAGNGGEAADPIIMEKDVKGTWVASVDGDLNGKYYTYTAVFGNTVNDDIVDPYARTVGVNGKRGMILDLDSTNPDGWNSDERHTYANTTDMSIYELHIRDFSSDPDCGIKNTGKYIAFTETGTTDSNGVPTGIDHLKDLGITTVHILPSYDFGSVDETKLDKPQFNWGYDPVNYNAPEGSYSTDPYHGEVRVNEYKQMVQSLHNAGIGVVMDVVYNHTYNTNYCFNKLVPGYFYRTDSNGSGCGNDVASERSMVSKFIVDSVAYWASEYHLDGFRFDLMGLIDTDTMNNVRAALDKIDPSICIYGEGWTMSTNISKEVSMANQSNASLTPGVGYFSDTIRDAIKGSVFEAEDPGYVNGNLKKAAGIKNGVLGTPSWSPAPTQTITYSSCHDNYTLWDKIASSNPDDSEADRIKQNLLAAAIVYTSQGVPFIQAGEEFLRTKVKEDGTFEHNSYASPDSVNLLDYSRITDYKDVYNYYKGLISFRKAHSAFRMTTNEDVNKYLSFVEDGLDDGVIAYSIDGAANNEVAEQIFVIYNPNREATNVTLPDGDWDVYVSGNQAGTTVLSTAKGEVSVEPISATVLVKGYNPEQPEESKEPSYYEEPESIPSDTDNSNGGSDDNTTSNTTSDNTTTNTGDTFPVMLVIGIALAAAAVIVVMIVLSKKSKSSK